MLGKITNSKDKGYKALIMGERVRSYVSAVNFVMITYLFIIQTEFNLLITALLILSIMIILALIDWKWILPKEMEWKSRKNPIMMDILEKEREIKEMLERMSEQDGYQE